MKSVSHRDIVETFGHLIEWDDISVGPVEPLSEKWRHVGDPACDAALQDVFSRPSATVGKDLLQSLREHVPVGHCNPEDSPAAAFLNEALQMPPPGLLASEEDIIIAQELFLDDSVQIMQAMLHFSLAGGLSSSRIVRTLEAVSYLLPHVKKTNATPPLSLAYLVSQVSQASVDRTFVRLVETLQFVLDVMGLGCSASDPSSQKWASDAGRTHSTSRSDRVAYLLPGGDGWKSAVRVRLLHGVARWRVEERLQKFPGVVDSVPISQEEVAATLAAFSTIPMWCLRRFHIPPTPRQANAYLALWRQVGFYMGVSPAILHHHFSSTAAADKFIVPTAFSLLFEEVPHLPSRPSTATAPLALRGPTIPILSAVSNRAPFYSTLEHNLALTTHLLGAPLAAHLALPATPLVTRVRMHALLLVQLVPHHFAWWYPRAAWREKRRTALRETMVNTVRANLGMRRTAFRPRTMGEDKGAGDGDGELAPGVVEAEGVEPDDLAQTRALVRQWWEVLIEMVLVCVVVCGLGGAFALVGLRYALLVLVEG